MLLLQYKEVFRKALTKLFADYHIRKKQLEERELNERLEVSHSTWVIW